MCRGRGQSWPAGLPGLGHRRGAGRDLARSQAHGGLLAVLVSAASCSSGAWVAGPAT